MTKLDDLESQGFLVGSSENALIIYPDKTGKAELTHRTTPPALLIFWHDGGFKEIIVEFNIKESVTGLNATQTYKAAAGVGLSKVIVYVFNPMELLMNLSCMMMVFQTLVNALEVV